MVPDRVSNPGPMTYESGALPIVLRGPADQREYLVIIWDNILLILHKFICCDFSSELSRRGVTTYGFTER